MRRGSNTTIDISAPDLDETLIVEVFVNINQLGITMKKPATLSNRMAHITLNADETRQFAPGPVFLQIEAVAKDGSTFQSGLIRYKISDTISELGGEKLVKSNNGFDK